MPFTFSHPAAILPFNKKFNKYFDLTALILGSMAPDFEYFIHFKPKGVIGHNLIGFFILNLPLCFILAYIFHRIIKKPFILNLPTPLDKWFYKFTYKKWHLNSLNKIIIFVYSSLIGMITHVLWDSFTHAHGKFVLKFTILQNKIYFINFKIPIYKVLQHSSTLIGALFIILYIYNRRNLDTSFKSVSRKNKILYYTIISLISFLFILVGFYLNFIELNISTIGNLIMTFLDGLFIGTVISSILSNHILVKPRI